jgi:hypothetical protein
MLEISIRQVFVSNATRPSSMERPYCNKYSFLVGVMDRRLPSGVAGYAPRNGATSLRTSARRNLGPHCSTSVYTSAIQRYLLFYIIVSYYSANIYLVNSKFNFYLILYTIL